MPAGPLNTYCRTPNRNVSLKKIFLSKDVSKFIKRLYIDIIMSVSVVPFREFLSITKARFFAHSCAAFALVTQRTWHLAVDIRYSSALQLQNYY